MSLTLSRIGSIVRETGQALERIGYDLGWVYTGLERYREHLSRSKPVAPVNGHAPTVGKNVFIAPCANVVGNVTLGRGASVFYNCVVRGDGAAVTIGVNSNIQDGCTVGTAVSGINQTTTPVSIGDDVTVGHGATLRSCTVGDQALIGMGACVLEGAVVERGAMVAAGAVVMPNATVPTGELWGGNPAKMLRPLKDSERSFLPKSAAAYVELARAHKRDCDEVSAVLRTGL